MKHVIILCLECTEPGTAAAQHMRGTVSRVTAIKEDELVPELISSSERSIVRRLIAVTFGLVKSLRRDGLAFVRFHPLLVVHVGLLRALGIPVVVSLQGIPDSVYARGGVRRLFRPMLDAFIRLEAKWANVLIVPHSGVSMTAEETHGIKADMVVPNGFAIAKECEIVPADAEFVPHGNGSNDNAFVLFVGNFANWQGVPVMIAAAEDSRWPDGIRLVFAGGGSMANLVNEAVRRNKHIEYVGQLSPAEVRSYMLQSAVTLSIQDRVDATKNGVTPFKVMESISYGTPVIVSSLPGQTEMVRDTGAGLTIEPGNPEALVCAICRLMSDDRGELQQLKLRAQEAKDVFKWENSAAALQKAFTLAAAPLP